MDALDRTLQPTRRVLGDVDPAQPLDLTHPLLDGMQGFWLPLPRLVGSSRLYDLSSNANHGDLKDMDPSTDWGSSDERVYQHLDFRAEGSDRVEITGLSVPTDEFAIGWWSKTPVQHADGTQGWNDQWSIHSNGGESIKCEIQGSGTRGDLSFYAPNGINITSVDNVEDNTWRWQFLTASASRNIIRAESAEKSATNTWPSNGDLWTELFLGTRKGEVDSRDIKGDIIGPLLWGRYISGGESERLRNQARRGFPDLLNRRSDVGLLGGGGGTSPISGTFALTDSQEQFNATGQTEVSGTLSVTDGSETLTINGATKVSGTASITEAAEQISGVGAVITTGSVSITDSGEIISAVSSLQDITGTAQITDAAENVSATGEVKIAGTATLNDGTEEVIIVGQNDVTGSLSFADLAAEIAATGSVEVRGSLALTDSGETITARERVPARLATVDVRLEDIIIVNAKLTD